MSCQTPRVTRGAERSLLDLPAQPELGDRRHRGIRAAYARNLSTTTNRRRYPQSGSRSVPPRQPSPHARPMQRTTAPPYRGPLTAVRCLLTLLSLLSGLALLTGLTSVAGPAPPARAAKPAELVSTRPGAQPSTEPRAGQWVWPLDPPPAIVRGFDPPDAPWGSGHRGADLLGRPDQPVRSAGAGTVTYAGMLAGRGVVTVTHGDLRTTYEPVRAEVSAGAEVAAGDVLGTLETRLGHCLPRVCLHWGLRRGHVYLDPLDLLANGPARLLPLGGTAHNTHPPYSAPLADLGGFSAATDLPDPAPAVAPPNARPASPGPLWAPDPVRSGGHHTSRSPAWNSPEAALLGAAVSSGGFAAGGPGFALLAGLWR